MSRDKHKGVARRKFALAQLPLGDHGKRKIVYGFKAEPRAGKGATFRQQIRPRVDITADVRRLEKSGRVRRLRRSRGHFTPHIKTTILVLRDARVGR